MSAIIAIETSTEVCSAALNVDGKCVWTKKNLEGMSHSTLLAPYLEELQAYANKENIKVDAVAVSSGPGSYTGLRIGVSTAKGLCFGADIPLLSVDTLKIMAESAIATLSDIPVDALFCPMIDARRMEVYTAFFDKQYNKVKETAADIIDENSYADLLAKHPVYFFGNGAEKCKSKLTHPNAHFIQGIVPLAENMATEGEERFKAKDFKDVAYFEPFYLKEFVATVAKNKVLGGNN